MGLAMARVARAAMRKDLMAILLEVIALVGLAGLAWGVERMEGLDLDDSQKHSSGSSTAIYIHPSDWD